MFLLYQKNHKNFPEEIISEGRVYKINVDFRNILRITDMINDDFIAPGKKIEKLRSWLFKDSGDEHGGTFPLNSGYIYNAFIDFINGRDAGDGLPEVPREITCVGENLRDVELPPSLRDTPLKEGGSAVPYEKTGYQYTSDEEEREPQFCYNFDAEEIYAGFLSEYGIDLTDISFMHWYKFRILLNNLSAESAFKKKIELRFMDLSGFTGQTLADMAEAKAAVQLPSDEYDEEEQSREIEEFNETWGKAGG